MNNKQFYTKQALNDLVKHVGIIGSNIVLLVVHLGFIMLGDTFQVGLGILGMIFSMSAIPLSILKAQEKYEEVVDLAK